MRPQLVLRAGRPVAAGALSLATLAGGATAYAATQDTQKTNAHGSPTASATIALAKKPRTHLLKGRALHVSGAVRSVQAGQAVALQVRKGGRWITLDHDATDPTGRYSLRYRTKRTGSWPLRVRAATGNRLLGRLNVYRHAAASWYGPGLFGGHLACGGTLTPGTLGVANKTLPCGTKVNLRYKGRSVRVPVVDRGPYVGGREYDLTSATKDKLGFRGHGYVLATK
jgi:rare lipoprotein A (peptidoglycan hydrolase)